MIDFRLKEMENAEILNVRDIMALFRVDRETVYDWRRKGLLAMKKIGGRWYAKTEDVRKLAE